jgi:hypothetical protein
MDERGKPVSDWQLERLAQGELDEAAAREVESRLGAEQTKQRLAELETSNRAILERLPPQVVSASIRRRLEPKRSPRGRLLMVVLPFAMAAGVWAVGFSPQVASVPENPEIILTKGSAHLYAYRAAGQGQKPARLKDAARVRPHDTLQLTYTAGDARFGAVLSVDGRGVVTVHLPVDAAAPAPLAAGSETNLPRAYELDDAPGFERFFLITAPKGFSLAQVLDAARALASGGDARRKPLSLPAGLSQESLLLEKVQP